MSGSGVLASTVESEPWWEVALPSHQDMGLVGHSLPMGFDRYLRVRLPLLGTGPDLGRRVRWGEAAGVVGRSVTPESGSEVLPASYDAAAFDRAHGVPVRLESSQISREWNAVASALGLAGERLSVPDCCSMDAVTFVALIDGLAEADDLVIGRLELAAILAGTHVTEVQFLARDAAQVVSGGYWSAVRALSVEEMAGAWHDVVPLEEGLSPLPDDLWDADRRWLLRLYYDDPEALLACSGTAADRLLGDERLEIHEVTLDTRLFTPKGGRPAAQ